MRNHKYRSEFIDPIDPEILEWMDRRLGLSGFDNSKSVPVRRRAFPDELLSTYVGRLSAANGAPWGVLLGDLGIDAGKSLDLFDTGLNFALLRALSYHVYPTKAYFHRILRMPFRFFFGPKDNLYVLSTAKTEGTYANGRSWLQYCPLCLKEDDRPYFRRRWRLVSVTCCQKHSCILHDRCPICKIRPSRRDFSIDCCHQSYAEAPVIPADTEALALEAWQDRSMQMLLARQNSFKEHRILHLHAAAMSWLNNSDIGPVLALSPNERHRLNVKVARAISTAFSTGDTAFDAQNLEMKVDLVSQSRFQQLAQQSPESIDIQTFVRRVLGAGFKAGEIDVEDVWKRFSGRPDQLSLVLRRRHDADVLWRKYQQHWHRIAMAVGQDLPSNPKLQNQT